MQLKFIDSIKKQRDEEIYQQNIISMVKGACLPKNILTKDDKYKPIC